MNVADEKPRSVPPDETGVDVEEQQTAPDTAEGPPPSQDEPPAPGGGMPPRSN